MINHTRIAFDGPVELVKDIFDTAARQERATALQLVRVCKTARHWVMPILYETVELDNPSALRFESMLTMGSSSEITSLVKDIRATCLPNVDVLSSRCTGLRAITLANYDVPRLHRLSLPSLTHLTICGFLRYAHLSPSIPALKTITHLSFPNDVPRLSTDSAQSLRRLTHFSCCYWLNKATQHRELEDCLKAVLTSPVLRVALVYVKQDTAENMRAVSDVINLIRDPRVVIVASDRASPQQQGNLLPTQDPLWNFAENVIESRTLSTR